MSFGQAHKYHQQRGVALIIALIITTIALTLAAAVIYRQQLHIRLTGNIANLGQAYQYASGMEDWAGTILEKDYQDDPKVDSLDEDWATLLPPIPIPGGTMNGQLFDLQARINLNSLAEKQRPRKRNSNTTTNPQSGRQSPQTNNNQTNNNRPNKPPPLDIAAVTRARLTRLIQETIDPDGDMGPAENFADILKDWVDADQINGNISNNPNDNQGGSGSGAESPHYQSLEHPYYSASTMMVSPTELRLLKDVNDKIYQKLLPFVSTLPIAEKGRPVNTAININTASEEIFRAIGFSESAAKNIIKERDDKEEPDKKAFASMQDFLQLEDVKNAIPANPDPNNPPAVSKDNLTVKSDFFLLQGVVKINNAQLYINSILYRKNGKVSVIMRDFSNPQSFPKTSDSDG
jgi:general secretion pathway protein K